MLKREDYLEHAEWLLNEGDPERASDVCRRGLRRFPRDHELWCLLGDTLVESGHYPEADRALRTASQLKKDWAVPLAKRAEVLLMLGKFKRAKAICDSAYDQDPNSALTSYMKGILLDVTGQHEVAHFFYRRAHKLDPNTYRKPLVVGQEEFDKVAWEAIQEVVATPWGQAKLANAQWTILDYIDAANPDFAGHAPLFGCYLATESVAAAPTTSKRRLPKKTAPQVEVARAYIIRSNIIRNAEMVGVLNLQISLSISEALEDHFGPEVLGSDEIPF